MFANKLSFTDFQNILVSFGLTGVCFESYHTIYQQSDNLTDFVNQIEKFHEAIEENIDLDDADFVDVCNELFNS